jgi:hypothetical protein
MLPSVIGKSSSRLMLVLCPAMVIDLLPTSEEPTGRFTIIR